MAIIKLTTLDGVPVEFVDQIIGSGAMKDVYFSPDRSYVVAFFRQKQDYQARDRIIQIAGRFRENLFTQAGGDYWRNLFCWPTGVVEYNGKVGVVAPAYQPHFFFKYGSPNNDSMLGIKGKEKEGKWFASAKNRSRYLDPRELGDWLSHLRVCLLVSRAVRRMHAAGLAHSDLSYKNVLVDPSSGQACIIDVDGLVVPGRFPPDVVGTPDFIAPEVVGTCHLSRDDAARKLPNISTDRHALAVLIYMYLLYRHPLRGDKVHDLEPNKDETLSMGERALFIEHPIDASNRVKVANCQKSELPWKDTSKLPYSITGPFLSPLIDRAFIEGLKDPARRPTADEWEHALVKTVDLIQPCLNPACAQKWYVFANTKKPVCPFCSAPYSGRLPVLNLYSARRAGEFKPDNHRLMVYTNQSLFLWHANRNISPNERLPDEHKKRVGYFVLHQGRWYLVNERLPDLTDVETKEVFTLGTKMELVDGRQILLSKADGGRLVIVQMIEA
ncbi:MAG: lipopolysaccharide kinase InaA family protein [Vicinamibacteria bacterium]